MKELYFVLSYTGTFLSRIIKGFTKDEFSHVSISLDVNLNEMYSFGRLKPYNAFIGGFVHEYINKGTFKRFYNTEAKIYCIKVTRDQYEKVKCLIEDMDRQKDSYKFNILGLFAAGFRKKISGKHSFYCAEFVKYVMDTAGIKTGLPKVVKPEDFKYIEGTEEIYSGTLRKYHYSKVKALEVLSKNTIKNM